MNSYWVYILTNASNTLYVGVTNDLQRRLYEHRQAIADKPRDSSATPQNDRARHAERSEASPANAGLSFTTKYNINKLVYFQEFSNAKDAIAAEKKIKGWTRKKKMELIKTINPLFKDLSEEL